MEKYDYLNAVTEDVKDYILMNYETEELKQLLQEREDFEEQLNDDLWAEDEITGNGPDGYNISEDTAAIYVGQNFRLAGEAMEEFCVPAENLKKGPKYLDTTIRCYLLNQAISAAVSEIIQENPDLETTDK